MCIWSVLCFNKKRMRLMAVLVALIRLWFMSSWRIDWKRHWTKPCRAHAVKHNYMNSIKTNLPHLIASPVCTEITFMSILTNPHISSISMFSSFYDLKASFICTILGPQYDASAIIFKPDLALWPKMSYSNWAALPLASAPHRGSNQ